MRVEAPSDEAGRHRIGNPIDGDGAVAGDIDGDHGEIGGSPCGQLLEYPAFCIDARSMPPGLSGALRLNDLAPGLNPDELSAAPPAYGKLGRASWREGVGQCRLLAVLCV